MYRMATTQTRISRSETNQTARYPRGKKFDISYFGVGPQSRPVTGMFFKKFVIFKIFNWLLTSYTELELAIVGL